MDKINSAFHKTLQRYGITNVWLSQESGVNDKMISRFRNGKTTIQTDTLQKLLDALPHEARVYFFSQVLEKSLDMTQLLPIEQQIANLSIQSKKQLVMEIVESLVQEREVVLN